MSKLQESLVNKFKQHRVVFWYDEKQEFVQDFEEMTLPEIKKIRVNGNEFEIKYQILKQSPEEKILLYFDCAEPAYKENWLLDVQLAHDVFRTEIEALYLQELGLDYHLKEFVTEHLYFFQAKERRQKLKHIISPEDTLRELRFKMLSVVFGTEYINIQAFIHAHAAVFLNNNDQVDKDLLRYHLHEFYWKEIHQYSNYTSESPSIYDFLLRVFKDNFSLEASRQLKRETRLLISSWKESIPYRGDFCRLSDKIATDLQIEAMLQSATLDSILNDDLFQLLDKKIIHELVQLILADSIAYDKVLFIIKQRENKFWYEDHQHLYQALLFASELLFYVKKYKHQSYASFEDGIHHYAKELFAIDQDYRKFIWHYRKSNQNRILADLAERVEKVYSNDWLLTYNNHWQSIVNDLDQWPNRTRFSQQEFFTQHVKPFLDKGQRLFIIISDAFRYECGEELYQRLLSENRYSAGLTTMVSCLPSYTQLGMASLLPGTSYSLQTGSDIVHVDHISSAGIEGRKKILSENLKVRTTAIQAEDLMRMNAAKEGREFVKDHDLIYIYHNRIDKVGDDKTSENKVFEAVDQEITFLIDIIKKIANMNGVNMIITTDHGFVYQHQELHESDYSGASFDGEIWKSNRRFVIGKQLKGDALSKAFTGSDLNLENDIDILIPKSINRLRVKGAGARFIHGGAAMQEIVIPVITVSKKREDTTSKVKIDIIKSTDRITTNILPVSFIQEQLISDNVLSRTIRAGIYASDGVLLSDQFTYTFDISAGLERQREVKHKFQISGIASGDYKNQSVKLILEEPIDNTTQWRKYSEHNYTLNISFTNDFDG